MHDLTPQLRTRLSRVERGVGVFVLLAGLLLAGSFGYYAYHTARRKGWLDTTVTYCTTIDSGAGLAVGDPVKLWGFDVGEITRIDTQPPDDIANVYVEFTVRAPYFGYLCTGGTKARITSADFLGKRSVEVTKGTNYVPTHLVWPVREYRLTELQGLASFTNKLFLDQLRTPSNNLTRVLEPVRPATLAALAAAGVETVRITDRSHDLPGVSMVWNLASNQYEPYLPTHIHWLQPEETKALTERLDGLINETERALTQNLPAVMSNVTRLTAHADEMVVQTGPLMSNVTTIAAHLTNADGSLGNWLLSTDLRGHLLTTMTQADGTLATASVALTNASAMMAGANSNLIAMVAQLQPPLASLSGIISNLNLQVQANTNFVGTVSQLLVHTDELIQGFKRHWFLRGAFRAPVTNAPPKAARPSTTPKGAQH